jgi:hypothetical protein
VFPGLEGLYRYMIVNGADLEDCVIVELDGQPSDDVDFDSDQGAVLVIPTEIVACRRVDPGLIERVQAELARRSATQ